METLVLITGANSGLGFELAAQLMARGCYHVLMGSRSIEKGNAALKELQSQNLPGTIKLLHLDVTDDTTIEHAVAAIEKNYGKLDMLVNNAGIGSQRSPGPKQLREKLQEAFNTNAAGPATLTDALAPLLQNSTKSPAIVNVSSGAGSINRRLDVSSPHYKIQAVPYRASKAALNMITACQWVEYGPAIKVFAYNPGFVQSNLGPQNKAEFGAKPASTGALPLIDILEGKRDDEVGTFLNFEEHYLW